MRKQNLSCFAGITTLKPLWANNSRARPKQSSVCSHSTKPGTNQIRSLAIVETKIHNCATAKSCGVKIRLISSPHNAIVVLYQLSYDPEPISDCRLRIADCNFRSIKHVLVRP